jgi:hypothetical protein
VDLGRCAGTLRAHLTAQVGARITGRGWSSNREGVSMQVEATRLYRVRDVAEHFGVSVATIYWTQTTTALLNGHPVVVDQDHRRWSVANYALGAHAIPTEDEPIVLTLTAPISLTVEDVAVLLFDGSYLTYEELADDHLVRELIAGTVINRGCCHLEELRCRLDKYTSLTQDAATWLAYCRQRAVAVFGQQ